MIWRRRFDMARHVVPAVFGCLVFASPAHAASTTLNEKLVPAKAGSSCSFGLYHSGAVGLVILSGPDVPGAAGNEVNNVYRVFYGLPGTETSPPRVGLAGWLMSSFDGRYAFAPAVLQNETPQTLIGNFRLDVDVIRPDQLPLASWLTTLAEISKSPLTAELRAITNAKSVATAVSPCFSEPWDGKP